MSTRLFKNEYEKTIRHNTVSNNATNKQNKTIAIKYKGKLAEIRNNQKVMTPEDKQNTQCK